MGEFDSPPFLNLTLKELSCVKVKRKSEIKSVNHGSADYTPQITSKCSSLPIFVKFYWNTSKLI